MLTERRISQGIETREAYRKVGAVVFIQNTQGQLLLLQEQGKTHDTDGAKDGDYSVVCETGILGEDWASNVMRGIEEELGPAIAASGHLAIDPNQCFVGESVFSPGVLARVVILHYQGNPTNTLRIAGDGEVTVAGWEDPGKILQFPLRSGVRKILQECLQEGLFDRLDASGQGLLPLSLENLRASAFRTSPN